ncbi:MAG: AAA family ATPase [Coprobacillus sp.]|nr:AAA family ATPase [Coprobacillus sp.]
MYLKRKIDDKLFEWKKTCQGQKALLIEGARRVGKTSSILEFAKNNYKSYIYIDFSVDNPDTKKIFDVFPDLDTFFNMLETLKETKLYLRESLIIFDEIQDYPYARQCIKTLVADGRYDYIETGSLISVRSSVTNIRIPSEERHIKMYPLDFEEYLMATDNNLLLDYIKEHFKSLEPMGEVMHKRAMKLLREYFIVGGMPQAVIKYIETKSFECVDQEKHDILSLYRDDVAKYAKGYDFRVREVFDSIPSQLERKEKKMKVSTFRKGARSRTYHDAFVWLDDAMITICAYNAKDPSAMMALGVENSLVKVYMEDIGLLISMALPNVPSQNNYLYQAILRDDLSINEGMLTESYVAQQLMAKHNELFYYSRKDPYDRNKTMEIDFLTLDNKYNVVPIEVKSSKRLTHSSLDKFRTKFSDRIGKSYLLYQGDIKKEDNIIYLPLYMAFCL